MRLEYIGETFFLGLTDGKIYETRDYDEDYYSVFDDAGEDWYLYGKVNPAPADDSSKGGRWEIIEE